MSETLFHYQATNAQGVTVTGHMKGTTQQAVYRRLQVSAENRPDRAGQHAVSPSIRDVQNDARRRDD